ncbi:atypical/PIKK/FRAP protein kinase [Sistotremastrum niveocremeum HHB9708]|uniref:Serine/threonine-protein kinase TOR n=1 Tax=Sistotremastrum niveocremeum HHB9708 TaxID=1314777 RepID=A0A164W0N3_9AGAM|nr:atypical/PIKK/FRAP protein kinase [Sistotremastrum niveocremeum HHB9708]
MANVQGSADALHQIFAGLKSRSESTRLQAARDLNRYVSTTIAEMPSDVAKIFDDTINKRLFELVHSVHNAEQFGGIAAIDSMLELPVDNLYRLFSYLKTLLPNADVNVMIAASKTLGKIAEVGGQAFGERFMDFEVADAVEQLQKEKQESGRYAGVLILKELARNIPVYFHAHIALVFSQIMVPLRDSRSNVREGAAELLAACLDIIVQREKGSKSTFLTKLLSETQTALAPIALKTPTPEVIHGSLLTYRELLLHAGMFMRDQFYDTSNNILRFKQHKDPLVRQTVVGLIPTLAMYDTQSFTEHFLHQAMGHLLSQLDKPNERARAFIAIGYVATAVKSEMKHFLEPIMQSVKSGLQQHGRKNAPLEEPIFQCIGMLASSVGPNLTKLLHDQLDLMFACGLTDALRQTLVLIARHIPPLLRTVQERLLDLISHTLIGQPYKTVNAVLPGRRPDLVVNHDLHVTHGATVGKEALSLALNTLGSFDFTGHSLNEFVRTCVVPYLEDDNPDVRKAAALTCCRLFVRDPIVYHTSNTSIEVISDVLENLLTVGIADPDPSIREVVLFNLDERFDKHLAQAENVRSLFIALNDEVFENRVMAVRLIGRLAMHNPAYVVPSLRKAILQLMTELEYSTVMRSREQCSRLLSLLVAATPRLMKPYALTMVRALCHKAEDPNPVVAANIMTLLGDLSAIGMDDIYAWVPMIMKVAMTTLEDPAAASKRDAALRTLGQVCASTAYVITPFVEYPNLLPILVKLLHTEPRQSVRREVVRVLGILGAIDPYRSKRKFNDEQWQEVLAINMIPTAKTPNLASDDYFQGVVVTSLIGMLKDASLSNHHHQVVEAIMTIFKTQGLKCAVHLPQIFPALAMVTRTSLARLQDFYLQQLAMLVGIIKEHIRNFTPELLALLVELWENVSLHLSIVRVIESLGKALDAEFKPFIPMILPPILRVFDLELNEKRSQTQIKIFHALITFGSNVEEYMHLILPIVMKTAERADGSMSLRKAAVQCIEGLSRRVNFSDHASRIIHPLVRTLASPYPDLRTSIMDTFCALISQLGSDFAIFVPTINKAISRYRVSHQKYENLVAKLLNGERLPEISSVELVMSDFNKMSEFAAPSEPPKLTVNQQHLKQAWDVSSVSTKEEWAEWIQRLSVEFLKESPSHALRACMSLVDSHQPLARELFNVAFMSCWTELYDQYQEDLVQAIEYAITSPTVPLDLVPRLLNLAEFMEHEDKRLPIENKMLGEYALGCNAYAKALHFKELEFFDDNNPSSQVVESLISINTKLQQHDAAWGMLTVARDMFDLSTHEAWFERLGRWQEALDVYNARYDEDPTDSETVLGRMRCLHALGEWAQLAQDVDEFWVNASSDHRTEIAPLAAAAAWSLSEWDAMDDYIASMKPDSLDRAFYRAILAVHRNQFPRAMQQISKARDLLEPDLTSLVGENYGRSYSLMIRAQALSELEEVITYKQHADQPDRRAMMHRTWMERLQGCQPDVEIWQMILQIRSLVMGPEEDATMWIKFGNLCRKAKRFPLAEKVFLALSGPDKDAAPPPVAYAKLKLDWAKTPDEHCLADLRDFANRLTRESRADGSERQTRTIHAKAKAEQTHLLARCYFKLGEWRLELDQDWNAGNAKDILDAYYLATQFDPEWYKAWHSWALANFEVVNRLAAQNEDLVESMANTNLTSHTIAAMKGFFRSIALSGENALQDTLRLLTLWFKYGFNEEVNHTLVSNFSTIPIEMWLEVVPQIIARIQTHSPMIRRSISLILNDVGRQHPQALIYPLTVASKSTNPARRDEAAALMAAMRQHSLEIVEQAKLVSEELLRVAILWNEMWHEGLEEASRLYYTEKNPEAMFAVLAPLHQMLEDGATTSREIAFAQVFGRELKEARRACEQYQRTNDLSFVDQAWDIYYSVFRKIERQMSQVTSLDLAYVSPALEKAKNLELAVPGTYKPGNKEIIKIAKFSPKMTVITSKSRPRRLSLKGSDGHDYEYGLKGHEDLRQDERVMQLFSLVNDLLAVDTNSFKRRLHIQRYPVVPLAPNAGLMGWVLGADTIHSLIRDYRESRKVLLDIERKLILQMAPDFEISHFLQKIEVFEYALEHTTGQDLYRVLWLKSTNSEHWLERRATYTNSLAVNSMVGHVLGLGDRHPSNILLERETGKVVHIDFGDCFEVAMHREKYPEKVPFRLTRMLVHAMEVSGIKGSFTNTCEITMEVLRENRESLMAVLEALVYDPLISWRLVQTDQNNAEGGQNVVRLPAQPKSERLTRPKRADETRIFPGNNIDGQAAHSEVTNERALRVYNRVKDKLTGRDFDPSEVLTVEAQVEKLIDQAMDIERLAQHFSGWCAFW